MLIWGQWLGSNCLCQAFHFHPTPLSPVSGSGDVKYVMHSHSVRTKSLFPHVDTDHDCRRMLPFSSELRPVLGIFFCRLRLNVDERRRAEISPTRWLPPGSLFPSSRSLALAVISLSRVRFPPHRAWHSFPPLAYQKVCFPSSALGVVFTDVSSTAMWHLVEPAPFVLFRDQPLIQKSRLLPLRR